MIRKKYLWALVVGVSLAVSALLASDVFAWKAIRPICDANGKVTGWKDEQIPDDRVPIGASDIKDSVGVFGYPKEEYVWKITPEEAGIDTSDAGKLKAQFSYLKVYPGDELPDSGTWNGRCYMQLQCAGLGMEIKPMKDYVGDFQFDLVDKEGRLRTRKVYQFRKGYYGEGGLRYRNQVYFFAPPDLRGMSILVWKPVDERQADDNWIYLPALRRVRRIAAAQKMDSFGGTDMTNDQIDRATGMWDAKVIGEITLDVEKPPLKGCYGTENHRGELQGKHCVIVEMIPRNKDWPVGRELVYFDKKMATWYYEETYDKGGKLVKVLQPWLEHTYPKQPRYYTFGDWYAHDLRTNHKTRMILPEIDKVGYHVLDYSPDKRDWSNYVFWYDVGYSDDYLSQKFMMTGTR
ncbi:MAG TPA: outer membrane lipoprotein-sorting protein [Thermodesulfobacteriota bacterium]|nr:outer membrane lipoprotein-sorting protein [Thermodesulfobacteriota bacterium]